MNAAQRAQLSQLLHARRDAIAECWYKAVARTSFARLGGTEVRQHLREMTQQAISVLLTEPFQQERAETIGMSLAHLHYIQPEALGRTQEVLAQQLVAGLPADQVAALQPRLAALLGALAVGFFRQAREIILTEQERARSAVFAALRRAEEALHESEVRLRTVMTGAPIVLFAVDRDGVVTFVEGSGLKLLGVEAASWVGRSIFDTSDNAAQIRQNFRRALAGEAFTSTVEVGELVFDTLYSPLRDEKGEVTGVIGVSTDVTTEMRKRVALRQSRERFRTLFESSPIGIAILNPKGELLQANRALQDMLGYSEDELRGMVFKDFTHPDDLEEHLRLYGELSDGKRTHFRTQARYCRKDNRVVWGNVAFSALPDASGERQHTFAMVEDITERKQAEEALRESQQFSQRIANVSPYLIYVFDLHEQRNVYINDRISEILGYTPQQLQGMGAAMIENVVHPDDRERVAEHLRRLATDTRDEIYEIVYRAKHAHGGWRWLRGRDIVFTRFADGVPLQLLGTAEDITERRQAETALLESEERFRTMFEFAPIGIAVGDSEGNLVQANRAFQDILGYTEDELCQMTFADVTHPDDLEENLGLYRELMDGARTHYQMQKRYYRKDGRLVWVNLAVSKVSDPSGKLRHIFAMIEDITERKRAEAELLQSHKMASMGVMAGGIAHELRNPLSIISTTAQLLLNHPVDSQLYRQGIQKICTATERASGIISSMLQLARPQTDLTLETDLHALLEETLPLVEDYIASRGISLRKELQADLPTVSGNPGLLQQVFTNLILNACNAMPHGGTLTVISRAIQEGEDAPGALPDSPRAVEIRFRDTGRGIPQEHLPKIFDPFFTTMPVGEGSGLGLALSYHIIKQHKGTIEVESEVNQGTTVIIRLPAPQGARSGERTHQEENYA